jgi:cytosine/creatinine deaminase
MLTTRSAMLMRRDGYGIAPGNGADFVVFDCADARSAVAELVPPLFGLKDGRLTFTRPRATLRPQRAGDEVAMIGVLVHSS